MTPVYLNTPSSSFPLVELKDEQHLQLFLSPPQGGASIHGLSTSSFNPAHDQRASLLFGDPKPHAHKVAQYHARSSDDKPFSLSSFQQVNGTTNDIHKCSSSKRSEDNLEKEASGANGSTKRMPSKMRLMQQMVKSTDNVPMKFTLKLQDQRNHVDDRSSSNNNNYNNSTIRVCSDCNTTTTPLWRSGPRGPKSLCNACGIRRRKARRAAEVAAAAQADAENGMLMTNIDSSPTTKINKVHVNKEKKCRTSHIGQSKKLCKPPDSFTHQSPKKLGFKNIALSLSKNSAFQGVFSQDVEEAAILLMELSCGFVHS